MENAIRIDVRELIAISDSLEGLAYEMNNQAERLKWVRRRFLDGHEDEIQGELTHIQHSIIRMVEQTEETARRAMQAAENFAICENVVKNRFWDLRAEAAGRIIALYAKDMRKNRG